MEGSAPGTLSPWGKSIILFSRGVTALFFVSVEEERVYIARIVTFRQYRIMKQERFASKFCALIRRGFAAILAVLQKITTKSGCKISAKRRSLNCAVLPYACGFSSPAASGNSANTFCTPQPANCASLAASVESSSYRTKCACPSAFM